MKKKILISILILLVIISVVTIILTADNNKWTIIHTKGRRIWLVSDADNPVVVRWDYYAWDSTTGKNYLSYAETYMQPGESFIMPITENIYIKTSSDNVKKIEGTKILISK